MFRCCRSGSVKRRFVLRTRKVVCSHVSTISPLDSSGVPVIVKLVGNVQFVQMEGR
jgi:hypothetical protein